MHWLYPEAESLVGLADAACAARRFRESVSRAKAALAIAEGAGFRVLAGNALTVLAAALAHQGDQQQAIDKAVSAAALHSETGCRLGEAHALATLGLIMHSRDPAAAAAHEQAAQTIFSACGAAPPPVTWLAVTTRTSAREDVTFRPRPRAGQR